MRQTDRIIKVFQGVMSVLLVVLSVITSKSVFAQLDIEEERIIVDQAMESYESSGDDERNLLTNNEVFRAFQEKGLALDEIKSLEPISYPADRPESIPDIIIDTIEAKNLSVVDVLDAIAVESGYTILADGRIDQDITVYLNNIAAFDAIRVILDMSDLAYVEEGQNSRNKPIIRVMTKTEYEKNRGHPFMSRLKTKTIVVAHVDPAKIMDGLNRLKSKDGKVFFNEQNRTFTFIDEEKNINSMIDYLANVDLPIENRVFLLNYIDVSEIVATIKEMLTEGIGTVDVQVESNSIIVKDTILNLKKVEAYIAQKDKPGKEIRIDAKAIRIILHDEHQEGVDWEAIVSDYQQLPFDGFSYQDKKGSDSLSIGTISDEDLIILIEALDTVGVLSTILKAETVVDKNVQTEFVLDQGYDMITNSQMPDDSDVIDEKIGFYVTPVDYQKDQIQLDLTPVKFNGEFIKSERRIDGKKFIIDVKNGSTVVIGSVFKDESIEFMRKIPLLGDLPFVGMAFRNEKLKLRKAELIVFLTVKLVDKEETVEKNN